MKNGFNRIDTTSSRLKKAMNIRNMKQADIVEKTGLNKGSLSSYISGRYEPKQDAINKLATALNVSEMWLWGYDVPMENKIEADPIGEANKLADWYLNLEMKEENSIMLEEFMQLDEQKQEQVREYIHFLSGRN